MSLLSRCPRCKDGVVTKSHKMCKRCEWKRDKAKIESEKKIESRFEILDL